MRVTAAVLGLALAANAARAQSILFVDDDAPLGGDGSSWNSAYRFLQDALDASWAITGDHEIRLAGGTYFPDQDSSGRQTPGDRDAKFWPPEDTLLIGGFRGLAPGGDPDDRDLHVFVSTLSGDIGVSGDPSDNSKQLLDAIGFTDADGTPWIALDGLVFSDAYNDAVSRAAISLRGFDVTIDSLVVQNLTNVRAIAVFGPFGPTDPPVSLWMNSTVVRNITSASRAVVVSAVGGEILIDNCTFESIDGIQPAGSISGGALYVDFLFLDSTEITGPFRVSNCRFESNSARNAGALLIDHVLFDFEIPPQFVVSGCEFVGNTATDAAGAMWISSENALIESCIFDGNAAGDLAGALLVSGKSTIIGCLFQNNEVVADSTSVRGGGALHTRTDTDLIDCTFIGNRTSVNGGAVRIQDVNVDDGAPLVTFTNCFFTGNEAGVGNTESGFSGAAISGEHASITMVNCVIADNTCPSRSAVTLNNPAPSRIDSSTFSGNHTQLGPAALSFSAGDDAEALVSNCIFWNNTSADPIGGSEEVDIAPDRLEYQYCTIRDWIGDPSGTAIQTSDPLFVDPIGPDGVPGTGDEDLRLSAGSPAIDAGLNDALPLDPFDLNSDGVINEQIPIDLDASPRTTDALADGRCRVDQGAYETAGAVCPCPIDLSTQGAPQGDPFFGVPDGVITGDDIQYYVYLWLQRSARADLTTQNAPLGDPYFGIPDGIIAGGDLQFYVNLWIAGCP